jgi:Uma2 family endonuclease
MSSTSEPVRYATAAGRRATPDELLAMPDEKDYELVAGVLTARHLGARSSFIGAKLTGLLHAYGEATGRAWVFGGTCGYVGMGRPDTVRRPDISVVLRERLAANAIPTGWAPFAPDIAAEVIAPGDPADELEVKVEEYLAASVRLVWVVYTEARVIQVHRLDGTEARLRAGDTLHGEDILPGFACPVAELFSPLATEPAS